LANVAVTGVTGFIGSHLASKLIELGHTVYGITRHCASRDLTPIKEIAEELVLLTADLTDAFSISHGLDSADPEVICHLGALTPVRLSFDRPFDYEKINYLGTMNLVHAVLRLPDYEKRKVIFASTAEVYGYSERQAKPFIEADSLNPLSPYAVSKAAADMYLRMASQVYGLDCVVLRPVNSYGRRFETGFLIEYLVSSMLRGERPCIGAPESIRDYIHVDDHVNAYIQAMERGKKGEAYNIGTGKGIKNRQLAETIADMVGYDKNKIVFGSYPPGYPSRPLISDQPYIILDFTKARRELDWSAKVQLEDGLERTIEYWRTRCSDKT